MCLGNRAENSVHYLNNQLVSLWQNAVRCSEKHGTGLKPTVSEVEFGTSLYQFYGPGKHARHNPSVQDLAFFATFDPPRIDFVCNHEIILFLNIKDGHYNLDVTKTLAKGDHHEKIEGFTVAFRLDFKIHPIENIQDTTIGTGSYTTNLFILDIATATLAPELSTLPGITTSPDESTSHTRERRLSALAHYLTRIYLPLFRRAGHHVLHSLPDFDTLDSTSAHIDYSVLARCAPAGAALGGVRVEDVNTHLKGRWLAAAAYLDEHGAAHAGGADADSHCIAEHESVISDSTGADVRVRMLCGPPQVKALCRREVVLLIDLHDVQFRIAGPGAPAEHAFTDWTIALIVDVAVRTSDGGAVTRITLDLSTARFCDHLSSLPGELADAELAARLRTILVRYVERGYLTVFARAGHDAIFHADKRVHVDSSASIDSDSDDEGEGEEDDDFEIGCECADAASCAHESSTGGPQIRWGVRSAARFGTTQSAAGAFVRVTALTQGLINTHLHAAWAAARTASGTKHAPEAATCLADWSFEHGDAKGEAALFGAAFGAPQIQLLCGEGSRSVVLYLRLLEGHLRVLGADGKPVAGGAAHTFRNWRVAFTVDLAVKEASNVSAALLKHLGLKDTDVSGLKQLVLDFSTAKFSQTRSAVPGLLDGTDYRLIRAKRAALLHHLTYGYFHALVRAHHHVLATAALSPHSGTKITHLSYQLCAFARGADGAPAEGLFGAQRAFFARNAVLLLGSTGPVPPGTAAVDGARALGGGPRDAPAGGLVLARSDALGPVLAALARVNAETTVLPAFAGVDEGKWVLRLTTWARHDFRKGRAAAWTELSGDSKDALVFEWRHRDDWRYEHEGGVGSDALYTVKCLTRNTVTVPTTQSRDGTCTITVRGSIKLALAYSGAHSNKTPDWSSDMSATWSAALVLASDANGVHAHLHPSAVRPEFQSTHAEGPGHTTTVETFAQLKEQLKSTIDLTPAITALRAALAGPGGAAGAGVLVGASARVLRTARPAFSRAGDLLLDLEFRDGAKPKQRRPAAASSATDGAAHAHEQRPSASHSNESWFRHFTHQVGDALGLAAGSPSSSPPGSPSSAAARAPPPLQARTNSQASATGAGNGHAAPAGADTTKRAAAGAETQKTNGHAAAGHPGGATGIGAKAGNAATATAGAVTGEQD